MVAVLVTGDSLNHLRRNSTADWLGITSRVSPSNHFHLSMSMNLNIFTTPIGTEDFTLSAVDRRLVGFRPNYRMCLLVLCDHGRRKMDNMLRLRLAGT